MSVTDNDLPSLPDAVRELRDAVADLATATRDLHAAIEAELAEAEDDQALLDAVRAWVARRG